MLTTLNHRFINRIAFMLVAVGSNMSVTYRNTKTKRKRKHCSTMGNSFNPPDTNKKLKKRPRGEGAVNRRVEVLYKNDDGSETWDRGTIIMYNRSKGYLVTFDELGPEGNSWEKGINNNDFRFID